MRDSGSLNLGRFFSIAEKVMGVWKRALNVLKTLLYFGNQLAEPEQKKHRHRFLSG